MLEDLCPASLSPVSLKCIDDYRACLAAAGLLNQQPNRLSKGRLNAWLASQAEPDKRLGQSAQAGMWEFDHPAFDKLKQFLRRL